MSNKPVAIVTGASRGIGKAIAKELASLDYDLVISHFDVTAEGQLDESFARQIKDEIHDLGVRCETLRADVSKTDDRLKLVNLAKDKFGKVDLLVNNAGVAPFKRIDILQANEESYDRVMAINLKGPYFLTQMVANWMIEQQGTAEKSKFRIINISSASSYTSSPGRGEYCLSKAGVSMMTKLYADRLAEYRIGVFEIRPGIIATDMTSVVKDKYDKLIAEGLTPIKRWGQPKDIADAVGVIALGKLDFSTGEVINVDGGFHLRRL
jgi:NAD(P)-dependent dehydrogenase (short-subunit alcohol dehydrogenase family)